SNQLMIYYCGRGVAQKNIDFEVFNSLKIPLPPLNIQKKIVAEIETLEQREQKAVEKIESKKNEIISYFIALKYEFVLLGDIVSFKNGLNYSRQSLGEVITVVGVGDFKEDFSPNPDKLEKIQIEGTLSQ